MSLILIQKICVALLLLSSLGAGIWAWRDESWAPFWERVGYTAVVAMIVPGILLSAGAVITVVVRAILFVFS